MRAGKGRKTGKEREGRVVDLSEVTTLRPYRNVCIIIIRNRLKKRNLMM